jgi:NAD(P)-dependent dehydrogenase (short-subunit alcohol dehydrogenase family)
VSQTKAFKHCVQHSPNNTVDIVLAIAGMNGYSIFQDSPFTSNPEEDLPPPSTKVLDVNLTGTYYTALLAINYFRHTAPSPADFAKANKQLIFVASNIAYFGVPLFSIYTASKAGVRGLWQSLRESPDLTGMRTNLVAPHIVRSPMTAFVQPLLDEKGLKLTEISEIVDVIMRMVCDEGIRGRSVAVHPGAAYDTCDGNEVCIERYVNVEDSGLTRYRSTRARLSMLNRTERRRRRFGSSWVD